MISGNIDVFGSTLSVLKCLLVTVSKIKNVISALKLGPLIINLNFLNYYEFRLKSTTASHYDEEPCHLIRHIINIHFH